MEKRTIRFFYLILAAWPLTGCAGSANSPSGPETVSPAAASATSTAPSFAETRSADPVAAAPPSSEDSGWILLRDGLERRVIRLQDAARNPIEEINILRVDPKWFLLDVGYDPLGKDLDAWQFATGADVVVNGGYFRREQEAFVPDGLIVVFGKAVGESYGAYAGMLISRDTGSELRWLKTTPYDSMEPLIAGLQSFPMLILPGGQAGFPEASDDHIAARRTVIGQDLEGRFLFLVASLGHFTLRSLSVFLKSSDLGLDIAMNLDGGPSSGMLIHQPRALIPSQSPLPIVILVYSK